MSAKQSKNIVLIDTIWNMIDPIGVSKITKPIDAILPIPNVKLADSAVFLSS